MRWPTFVADLTLGEARAAVDDFLARPIEHWHRLFHGFLSEYVAVKPRR